MTSRIYLCRQWTNQIAAFEVSVMSRINDATGPIRWHHKRFLLRHTETFHQLFLGWRNFQMSSLSLLISEIKKPPGWLGSSMTCVTRIAEDMSTRKVSRYCISVYVIQITNIISRYSMTGLLSIIVCQFMG